MTKTKQIEDIDEISELENILKVWKLKYEIQSIKSQYIALKQSMNETKETREALPVEDF
jgi:hypothetical protein